VCVYDSKTVNTHIPVVLRKGCGIVLAEVIESIVDLRICHIDVGQTYNA
jgi:hypothetical protein